MNTVDFLNNMPTQKCNTKKDVETKIPFFSGVWCLSLGVSMKDG